MPWTAPPSTWPRDDRRADHPADVVDRGVGDDAARRRCRDRPRPRRHGRRSARSARPRSPSRRHGCARPACLPASANRSMPRSVPTTEKRPARYSMSRGGGLERLGGEALGMVDGALGADLHRRAAGEERARAGAAEAVAAIGVALDDADPSRSARRTRRRRAARSWSAMPWPIACVAEKISMKPSGVTSIETVSSKARPLVHSRKVAMPRPRSLPRLLRLLAARGEAVPVGERQALVHDLLERAAVVGLAHRVRVGHLLGPDQVAPAQLRRIHLHLARRRVHQPLDQVDRLGPAGAAVRRRSAPCWSARR